MPLIHLYQLPIMELNIMASMDKIAAGMIQCSKISSSTNHGHLVRPPTTAAGIGKKPWGNTPVHSGFAAEPFCERRSFSSHKNFEGGALHNLFVMDSIHNPYLDL
jgi:hypothetical protein